MARIRGRSITMSSPISMSVVATNPKPAPGIGTILLRGGSMGTKGWGNPGIANIFSLIEGRKRHSVTGSPGATKSPGGSVVKHAGPLSCGSYGGIPPLSGTTGVEGILILDLE